MKNKFEKFEKNQFSGIYSIKGGMELAAKSVTTTTKTIERGNDLDSARDIESSATSKIVFEQNNDK